MSSRIIRMNNFATKKIYPHVTVGIPTYNCESYIRQAVNSVLCQSFSDFELIITDDGSTDKTLEIISEYNDPRVIIVADGENKGLPFRLNQQIKLAKGKYFIRMDADDVMFPSRIEQQIKYLDAHKEVDVIGARSIVINKNNNILFESAKNCKAPLTREDVMDGNIFIHPTVAGRTEWFRNNPYDEQKKRSQDFFLWLQTVEKSTFAIMDTPLIFYRVFGNDILKKFKNDNELMRSFYWSEFFHYKKIPMLFRYFLQLLRLPVFYIYYAFVGSSGILRRRYMPITKIEMQEYKQILSQVG